MFFFFTSPLHSSYLFHSLHSSHLVLADTTYSEYLNILPHKWKYMHTLSPLPLFQVSSPNYIIPSPPIHLLTTLSLPYSSHYFLILPLIHLLTTLSSPLFISSLPFLPHSSSHYLILPLIHLLTTLSSPLFISSLPFLLYSFTHFLISPLFISSLPFLLYSSPHFVISPPIHLLTTLSPPPLIHP